MSHPHDPVHAPEHHGLGPVKGGRLLVLVVAAVALVAVVAVWRACTGRGGPEAQAPTAAEGTVSLGEAAQKQAGIATAAVKRLTRSDRVEAPGVLALDEKRTARLGSMVEGMVVKAHAEVGDRVRSGQVLAEMHSHVVHDAWADYRKAVAERRHRETEQTFARQNEERAKRLLAEKAISQQELRRAEADRAAADEQLDMAKTEVRRAEEALEHYGVTNKEDPTGESGETIPVRSPLHGVVLEKSVTQGTAVTVGTPLYVVADLTELWAVAEIDETQLPLVTAGRPDRAARLRLPRRDVRRPDHLRGRHGQPEDPPGHRAVPGAEPQPAPQAGDVRLHHALRGRATRGAGGALGCRPGDRGQAPRVREDDEGLLRAARRHRRAGGRGLGRGPHRA